MSTAPDMAKWEIALQTDRILTPASKKQMWTPVKLNGGDDYPYGLGWEIDYFPNGIGPTGVPMIRHEGSIPGFRPVYWRLPDQKLSVIVLSNPSLTPPCPKYGFAAEPPIGTHPNLEEACRVLREFADDRDPFARIGGDVAFAWYGPDVATVQGFWRGRWVQSRFNLNDSGGHARWSRLVPVLPVPLIDQGVDIGDFI